MDIHRRNQARPRAALAALAATIAAATLTTVLAGPGPAAAATAAAAAAPAPVLTAYAGGLGFGAGTNVSQSAISLDAVGGRVLTVDGVSTGTGLPAMNYVVPGTVRALDVATGQVSVVAGSGQGAEVHTPEDGLAVFVDGPALTTPLSAGRVVGDAQGNVYVSDSIVSRIRKITAAGAITTIAGTGHPGFSGDGGPAADAELSGPDGLAFGPDGALYVADSGNHRVRRIGPDGIITTVAGNGTVGSAGDGGPATSAQLTVPRDVAVDAAGNLYIAETSEHRIRWVTAAGTMNTFAQVGRPLGMTAEAPGRILVAGWSAVLRIDASGATTIVAGHLTEAGFSGDGGPATAARLTDIRDVTSDGAGNLYLADSGNLRVRKVDAAGIITTVLGNGQQSYSGDGASAPGSRLWGPMAVHHGPTGTYFYDQGNERLRHIDLSGVIRTVREGFVMDIAVDPTGNLYIAEPGRIIKRTPAGSETVIAGTGDDTGSTGEGIPATLARLRPYAIALDGRGDLYITDSRAVSANRAVLLIRRVDASGTITTVAGNPSGGPTPLYPAPALGADLAGEDMAIGPDGSIYLVGGGRIIRILCGVVDYHAYDSPWLSYNSQGLAVDRDGTLFIAAMGTVRRVTPDGTSTTVAGGGTAYPLPGRTATGVKLEALGSGVALDQAGDLLFVERDRIFKVAGVSAGPAAPGPVCLRTGPPSGDLYNPVTPARLLDTRTSAAVGPGGTISVQVTGAAGVPLLGVSAVLFNLTVTSPSAAGYLSAVPSGAPAQGRASLTFWPGQTVGNLTVAKIGPDGKVDIFNSAGTTQVIADVVGWYGPAAGANDGRFTATYPSRILDTRTGIDAETRRFFANTTRSVQVTGVGNIPDNGIRAVVFNLTVTQPDAAGYLTVHPTGTVRPPTSSLNFVPGQTVGNLVVAEVGTDGKVDIYNAAGATHVIADVVGWYSEGGARLNTVDPSRILDTRTGTGGRSTPLGPDTTMALTVAGAGGVPSHGVSSVAMIVTVTRPTAASFLTVWHPEHTRPATSNLNFGPGQTVSNLVVASVGHNGKVQLYNLDGATDVIIDVVGWYGANVL